MSEYRLTFRDGNKIVAKGESPLAVLEKMFPDRKFKKVENASVGDVMVELVNGQKANRSIYKMASATPDSLLVISVCKEPPMEDFGSGVELAGIFSHPAKAQRAKEILQQWLNKEGYTEGEIFVQPTPVDMLNWYEISKLL